MRLDVLAGPEAEAVLKRIAALEDEVKKLKAGSPGTERAFLKPKEVAKRFGIREAIVYDALRSGRLVAEARPGQGQEHVFRILPADADAWYNAFQRSRDNQGGDA